MNFLGYCRWRLEFFKNVVNKWCIVDEFLYKYNVFALNKNCTVDLRNDQLTACLQKNLQ